MGNDVDLSSLLRRSIPINQDPLPSTDRARKAEAAENLKHKVYNTDSSHGGWFTKGKGAGGNTASEIPIEVQKKKDTV